MSMPSAWRRLPGQRPGPRCDPVAGVDAGTEARALPALTVPRARNRGEDVPGFGRGGQMIQQERAREPSAFMRDRITKKVSS